MPERAGLCEARQGRELESAVPEKARRKGRAHSSTNPEKAGRSDDWAEGIGAKGAGPDPERGGARAARPEAGRWPDCPSQGGQ